MRRGLKKRCICEKNRNTVNYYNVHMHYHISRESPQTISSYISNMGKIKACKKNVSKIVENKTCKKNVSKIVKNKTCKKNVQNELLDKFQRNFNKPKHKKKIHTKLVKREFSYKKNDDYYKIILSYSNILSHLFLVNVKINDLIII